MGSGDTGVNALIGGVVTLVTAGFVPFAPVFGGGVAGYLQGTDTRDGAVVGAVAGVIALVPFLLLTLVATGFVLSLVPIPLPVEASGAFVLVFVLALVFGALYLVGLSALGGVLGAYVAAETDL